MVKLLGSLWGHVTMAMKNASYSLRRWASPLRHGCPQSWGTTSVARKWWAIGLLLCVFLALPLCSQKLPVEPLCLSWPGRFYQAVPWWMDEGCTGRNEFMSPQLFSLVGLTAMRTDNLYWKVFFSPFVICWVRRIFLLGGPQEDEAGRFPHLQDLCIVLVKCGMLGPFVPLLCLWSGASLDVGQPPRPNCYLWPGSLPSGGCPTHTLHLYPVLWGLAECQILHASVSVLPSHPISPVHSAIPTFRCFNVQISQTCLCVEQGTLYWIIAVRLVVTLRIKTRRSSHAPTLLTSVHLFLILVICLLAMFSTSI